MDRNSNGLCHDDQHHHHHSSQVFHVILEGVGLPCCEVYGRIPSLCPLDACRTSRIFPDTATYPGGREEQHKIPLV